MRLTDLTLLVPLAILISTASGAAQQAVSLPLKDGQASFTMPSMNIECVYTQKGGSTVYRPRDGGPELSCDRAMPTYVRVILGPLGPAVLIKDPGDQGCCGGDTTLAYGRVWSQPPFTCRSDEHDLTCRRDDGHGFSMSRTEIEVH